MADLANASQYSPFFSTAALPVYTSGILSSSLQLGKNNSTNINSINNDVKRNLDNRYFPFPKVKYYNDVIGTSNFGKSSELVVKEILQIINNI